MAYEDMAVYIANLGKYNEGELGLRSLSTRTTWQNVSD